MAEAEAPEVTPPKEADLPQSSTPQFVTLDITPPEEVPTPVKKPRKPRPPKVVAKLAAVSETIPHRRKPRSP